MFEALNSFISAPQTFIVIQILVVTVFFILLYLWMSYNSFIIKLNQVKNDFSDIIIELKRRASLIDQLVVMVQEYAKHEKTTYENVTKARSALDTSKSIDDTVKAENMFTQTLRSLFAVVENYPDLKAQENFQSVMRSLEDTENRIANFRTEYNGTVQTYNNAVQMFPSNLIANLFRFKTESYFQVNTQEIN